MKTILAVAVTLTIASAAAQDVHYQEQVKFGDQMVTLKIVSAQPLSNSSGWVDPILREQDPETKAQGLFWRGYGDGLEELSNLREQAGDLTGAYAYQYAHSELAKFNERYWVKAFPKWQATAQEKAEEQRLWNKVSKPHYASIHKELTRLGQKLTAEDRKAAIFQAAQILRDNPNCCMEL